MPEPRIRFPDFKKEWKSQKLNKLTFFSGKKNKGDLPLEPYSITNIHGFISQSEAHDEFGYMQNTDRSAYIIVTPHSFGYNPARINVGSIGYYAGEKDVIVSSLYEVFKTREKLSDEFLMQWFQTPLFQNWVQKLQEGSVRQYFYYDKLCEVVLHFPELIEQHKIADFLSSVDNIVAASEKEVTALEAQKKAVMKKIFSQEVRFKRADGSDFPEWEETTIGEIGDVITGSTPSTKDEKNYGHDYCFCAPGDLGNGKYVVNTEKKVSEKGFVSGRAVPRGSVLATCIGSTIGKMGMAGCDMITNQQINSIVVKEDDSEYVYYAIGYCFPQYLSSVGKQAVPILSKSEFSKKSFPLPCLEEQRLIADFLSDFDEAIAAAKKELELWKELKKGLLQQMFV